ncbi:MAG: sulfur oxidation c-type cytochrome SoxX [Paracoccaceae bacterium]|jgi:sulfur-oxidizing protein SoxX|nr:sulfur oxidation c-type cytochrome SoxX [Paracoccaceae bacterium]
MKSHVVLAALAATLAATSAFAEVAPTEVTFEEGAVAQSLTGTAGNAEEGSKIVANRALGNCVACHVISANSADFQGNIGPTLDGAADRWSEAQLRGIVVDAKHTFPDSVMPGMFKTGPYIRPGDAYTGKAAPADLPPILTAAQVEDVVAYLLTLKE